MTKALQVDWAAIRTQFEAGIPAGKLAETHQVRANTIRVRAHREGWKDRQPAADEPVKVEPYARPPTLSGRPRIRARRPNGQQAPILPRDPESIGRILQRLSEGDSVRAVADDMNVTHQAIRMLLLSQAPEEYREAQQRGLIAQIADATAQLEEARDPVAIARARELCRFTRWDAERRLPHLFGQQTKLVHEAGPDLGEMLREARRRVTTIEGTAKPALPEQAEPHN